MFGDKQLGLYLWAIGDHMTFVNSRRAVKHKNLEPRSFAPYKGGAVAPKFPRDCAWADDSADGAGGHY